jgi:predicted  nucleic acid-binding Zn-ribbon protein
VVDSCMPLIGNLKCNDRNCGHVFLVRDFRSNNAIRCPHCGGSSQYRLADFLRENQSDRVVLAVLCQRAADDSALDEATRVKALNLKTEWVALQSPPASSYKEEQEAEARRERLAERMSALLATI